MTVSLPKEFLVSEVTVEFVDKTDLTGRIVAWDGNPHHFQLHNGTFRYIVLWDKVIDLRINNDKEG